MSRARQLFSCLATLQLMKAEAAYDARRIAGVRSELGNSSAIEKHPGLENETQNGEEVTPQHSDLLARLKNPRETERRLPWKPIEQNGVEHYYNWARNSLGASGIEKMT